MPNPGDLELIEQVSAHIERHVGPITMVYHEIVSDELHIDVHHVQPHSLRRFHTLVTSGMSERPMATPSEAADFRFAELVILLDPHWPISMEAFQDERYYWPVRLLKTLARYPLENDTWLGFGHSVAASPPGAYSPDTDLSGCILLPSLTLGEEFSRLRRTDGANTHFWAVIPLYEDEVELKMRQGTDALMDAMDRAKVTDVVYEKRPRATGQRKSWFHRFHL